MRGVVQRVREASVRIEGQSVAAIGPGLLILLGIARLDEPSDTDWLASKCLGLRIFPDKEGLMNRSVLDSGGDILVVSQFTLLGSTLKGNRPSFNDAARPEAAIPLYEAFVAALQSALGKPVQTGRFGADMAVSLVNDGPVTLVIDSRSRE